MADSDLLIQPLTIEPADFPPLPLQPGFAQLVMDELGDVATPADGFDDVLAEAVGIVDALAGALDSLGGELLDAFAEADLVDPAAAGDNLVAGSAAVGAAGAAVDTLGTLLTTSTSPTAPGAPPPPGAPTTPQCATLDFGSGPTSSPVGTATRALTIELQNTGATPLKVLRTSMSPDLGFSFQVFPSIVGAVVQPGASLAVRVTFQSGSAGTFNTTLTIHTDRPDPQPCLVLRASAFLGGGGGLLPVNPIGILRG